MWEMSEEFGSKRNIFWTSASLISIISDTTTKVRKCWNFCLNFVKYTLQRNVLLCWNEILKCYSCVASQEFGFGLWSKYLNSLVILEFVCIQCDFVVTKDHLSTFSTEFYCFVQEKWTFHNNLLFICSHLSLLVLCCILISSYSCLLLKRSVGNFSNVTLIYVHPLMRFNILPYHLFVGKRFLICISKVRLYSVVDTE